MDGFTTGNMQEWAEKNFGRAPFSDRRSVSRLTKLAARLAVRPGTSIPTACSTPAEIKGAYRFLSHQEATPDNILHTHRCDTLDAIKQPGTYLLLEDSSVLSWSAKVPIEGLEPVGRSQDSAMGFELHTVIATRWDPLMVDDEKHQKIPLDIVGIADQRNYTRPRGPVLKRRLATGSNRPLQTDRWIETIDRMPSDCPDARYIRICDRGADLYEAIQQSQAKGLEFVIRARHNRRTEDGKKLMDYVGEFQPLGSFDLYLRGRGKRAARTVKLLLSAAPISLKAPQRPGASRGQLPPIKCSAVRVWEDCPSKGNSPIEWILLVSEQVITLKAAREKAAQYSCRWLIEEFPKSLKTCLGAEQLQLRHKDRLVAAISLMSVIALGLVGLRDKYRLIPDASAEDSGLLPLELEVLRLRLSRPIRTIRDVALAIGRLGGHMNRKGDGMPGLLTLWRGLNLLVMLVEGAELALENQQLTTCG